MIVVNEITREAVRTDEPKKQLREWILRELPKGQIIGLEGEEVTFENIDGMLAHLNDECDTGGDDVFSGFLVVADHEEGSTGIGVGFSSSDRCSMVLRWPEALDEEDFLGNGDPTVYKTAGVPTGVVVKGETELLPAD
jgi:hypothetical protein